VNRVPKVQFWDVKSYHDPLFSGLTAFFGGGYRPRSCYFSDFMFGTIRKHQQWLWVIIVAGVIISFTAFFGPNQPSLRSMLGGGPDRGSIDGQPVTQDLIHRANRLTKLREHLFNSRGSSASETEQQVLQTMLVLGKLKSGKVDVSDDDVGAWIKQNLTDPKTGQFNYQAFLQRNILSAGFTEAEFTEFARFELGRRHLVELVTASGKWVSPREAESTLRNGLEETVASVVLFPLTNFTAGVQVQEAAVKLFYSNRIASYLVPARVQASYVQFLATNYLAQADAEIAKVGDLSTQLESMYQQRGADAFRDEKGSVMTKEAAFAKIKEEQRKAIALGIARSQCVAFYNRLNDAFGTESQKPEGSKFSFEAFASSAQQPLLTTVPFTRYSPVPGFAAARNLGDKVFGLSGEAPYTEPVTTDTGVYVFAVKQRIPEEYKPFEVVRADVVEAYKREQAGLAARTAGKAFQEAAVAGVAQGKTLAAVAAEKGLKAIDLPAFSAANRQVPGFEAVARELTEIGLSQKVGSVSDYSSSSSGGFVLAVKERRPADEAKVKEQLSSAIERLRDMNEYIAYEQWVTHEFEKSGLNKYLRSASVGPGAQ
jgi:hypothetical protein